MRALDIYKQMKNPAAARQDAAAAKSVAASEENARIFHESQGRIISRPDVTGDESIMDEGVRSKASDMIDSFDNAVDEINKSTYSFKLKPFQLRQQTAKREILSIQEKVARGEITQAEANRLIQQQQNELDNIEFDPEYRKVTQDINAEDADIANSPTSKKYEALSQKVNLEENSSFHDWLTYEAPKEFGGSASEIGTQLATTYGPQFINSLARKGLTAIAASEAATGGLATPAIPFVMAGLTVAEMGAGMYGLYKMRQSESQAEANDAYDQKVRQDIAKREAQTGHPISEKDKLDIEIAAHKGLKDIIAQNNNLSLSDAAEVLAMGTPWKALSGLAKTGKAASMLGKIGKGIAAFEELGTASRLGRNVKNVAGIGLTGLLEQMEETDQYSITQQYLAGKYKDDNSFYDNFKESLGHRKQSIEYATSGETEAGYEKDADYRNAARSGFILGGLMSGMGGVAKVYSDEKTFRDTAKDMKSMTQDQLDDEKAVYRANMYTKYFAADKSNFLFEGLENLARNAKDPEKAKMATQELVKAKEGHRLYEKLSDNNPLLSDGEVGTVFHRAQHLTSKLENMDKTEAEYAVEHAAKSLELKGLITDPTMSDLLTKRANLDAIRNNLDKYYNIKEEDKPSNIKKYEKQLEEKYQSALHEYKDTLEATKTTEDKVNEQVDHAAQLTAVEEKRNNLSLLKADLRNELINLHTKEGAKEFVQKEKAKAKPTKKEVVKPFDIEEATVPQYEAHEKQQVAEGRLGYKINKIDREAFERNIKSRLESGENVDNILEEVNTTNPKLGKEASALLKDAAANKKKEIDTSKKEAKDLATRQMELEADAAELEPDEVEEAAQINAEYAKNKQRLAELSPINAVDNTKFEREHDAFNQNLAKYQEEIPAATENKLKRNLKEKFLKGSKYIQDKFEKNPEYNDITTVKREIKRVKNLKKIYETRNAPEMKASKEFEGFTDTVDAHIAKLEEIQQEIETRLEDREARDNRIAKNEAVLALNQIGLNPDGTVVEGKENLNEISKSIIGESDYNRVMADAKGELNLTHGNILLQILSDNLTDPTRLKEAIANAKKEIARKLFALPNVNKAFAKNGRVFNMYLDSPFRMFKDLINGVSDTFAGGFDTKKSSSVYKFFKENDVAEFINDLNNEDRSGSPVSKEDILAVVKLHEQYASLFDLEATINSSADLHTQTSVEKAFEEELAADKNRKVVTPSNQQLVAIRQIVRFVLGKTGGKLFDDVSYLKGYAGTGKTTVVIRWAVKMLKLKTNEIYLAGHNKHSAETLSSALNKSAINDVDKLIADLPTMDASIKLIVLDEAPGVPVEKLAKVGELVHELNKGRKEKVKVLFTGDPNQRVANGKRSPIENPTVLKGSENMTTISPLTIRFRSDVAAIVDVQDLFIDQDQDLTRSTISTKANTLNPSTLSSSTPLLGVNGSLKDFDKDVMATLEARKNDRSRTRAIIVGNEADVAKYKAMLEAAGIENVQVMTDIDAQGRTINEVFVNIPFTNAYDDAKEYNTTMYTATSRATDYLYIGGFNVENNISDVIEENKEKKEAENKERSSKFIEQRANELEMMDRLLPEKEKPINNTQEASTEPIVDEEYNDFINNGIVPDSTLNEIADKIINGEELSDREKEIFADKTSEINDILVKYHEQNGTTTEKETDAPLDEETEVQENFKSEESFVEVPTTYDDDATLDEIEGNPGTTPARETPTGRKVYSVNYPTGRSISKKDKDGKYGPGVKPGDTVHYVKSYDGDTKKYYITIVSPVEGQKGKYYEVGVVSEKELKDGVNAQDPLFTLLQDAINDVTNETYPISSHNEEKGGILRVTGFYPIADGKINHTQKLSYKYGAAKAFNYFNIIGRFIKGFFPLGTRKSIDKLVKESKIRIYTKNEIGELSKKYTDRGQTIPFTPASGVPYLVINNISQGGEGESKQQFIRLTPAKLNKLKHSKYVKPVEKLINAIHKMTPYMGGIEFGTPEYSEIIKADAQHLQTLLPKLPAMDEETLAEFNQRREEIHSLVYVWEKERFSDNKDIKVNHHVQDITEDRMFDGTGRVIKTNENKDGKIVSFNVKLKDGTLITVPKENLERVAIEERKSGPAQIALNAIAKANANPNGLPIRTHKQVPVRGTNDFTIETAAKGLLIEHGETFSLEQLEELMTFDDEGNSKYIHVPLDIKYFKDDSKEKGFIIPNMHEYIDDTFDEVLPSAISISRPSAIKEKGTPVTETTNTKDALLKQLGKGIRYKNGNTEVFERIEAAGPIQYDDIVDELPITLKQSDGSIKNGIIRQEKDTGLWSWTISPIGKRGMTKDELFDSLTNHKIRKGKVTETIDLSSNKTTAPAATLSKTQQAWNKLGEAQQAAAPKPEPAKPVNVLPNTPTTTHTFPVSVAIGVKKVYIPRSVAEKAHANDIGNRKTQSLDEIQRRGGYSTGEMNKHYPNWYAESVAAMTPAATPAAPSVDAQLKTIEENRKAELNEWKEKTGGWNEISEKTEAYITNEKGQYLIVDTTKPGAFSDNKTPSTRLTETEDRGFEDKLASWSKSKGNIKLQVVKRWEDALKERNDKINAKYDAQRDKVKGTTPTPAATAAPVAKPAVSNERAKITDGINKGIALLTKQTEDVDVPGKQVKARFDNDSNIIDVGYYDEGKWVRSKSALSDHEKAEVTAVYKKGKRTLDRLKSNVPTKVLHLVDKLGSFAELRKVLETKYESAEIGTIINDVTNWMSMNTDAKFAKLSEALDKEIATPIATEEVVVTEPVTEAVVNENVPVKTQEEIDADRKKLLAKGRNQSSYGKPKNKLLAKGRNTSLGKLIKDPFALVRKIIPSMSNDDLKVVSESVMLELTEGIDAWGHFKNGVIYLLEGAEGVYHKVVRHEAFHRIFNNHLTEVERNQLIATARRINPLLKSETPLKVEEWLAEQYQNWTTKKGTISLALLNAFKKILKFLGLYRANFNNIENLFDAIDAGLLDKKGEVVEDSSRNLVKIRQDYLTTDHYRDARNLVIVGMNNRLNSTQWNGEKAELETISLLKDGSNIKEATPMPFEEAISDLRTEFEAMLAAYTEEVAGNPEDVEWNTYQKEIYTILNDERKAKDLLKEIYPSLYLGNKEFTEGLATSDEEILREIEEAQTNGSIYEDIIESDRLDQEAHVKRGVKDFLATIVDDGGNPVNPRMGYIKLLEGFVGVTTRNFKKLKEQIGLNMGINEKSSNKVNAIYNKIIDLITTADEGNAPEGKLVPNFEKVGYDFQNDDVYIYRDKNGKIQSVSRGKMTSVAFMKSIEALLNREEYNVSPNIINLQYKRAVAKEVLCQIRTSIGSQRKKNVMIAVRSTTQWDSDTGKDFYAITYRYNSVREQGAKQNMRAAIETAFLTKGDSIPDELKERFLTTKEDNSEATTKNIEDLIKFLGLGVPTIIKGEEYDVHASLKNLFQQIKNIGKETEVMKANDDDQLAKTKEVFTWDKFLQDSNQRLEKLTDLLVKDNEDLRPVSYISGDGKKRYEWMNSSTAIDTLTHMTVGFRENRPDFVKSAIFLRNIFFGNNKDKRAHNKIHRFVDHDSIKDKDNKYRPTPYKSETYEQWMHRNINYTFTSLIGNSKLSKGIRYIQQFFTISNKPQTIGAEIDLKKASDIRAVIREAIMQEVERPELDAQSYDKNHSKSYLSGLETKDLIAMRDAQEEEHMDISGKESEFEKLVDAAVEKVHKGLDKVSEELVNHLFDAKFVLDYEISKTQAKLLDYIDAKYKTADGKALLEKHTLPSSLQSFKNKEYNLTKEQLMPLIDLWAKNFYMNGHFLNQLVSGDQAFYKNPADQVKRMSMAFAMGYTGMVNDNGFMKETFKVAVADKLMFGITDKQFKKHRQFYGLTGEAADAQGYHTPGRAANIKRGFGKEMQLGAVMKPIYWGLNKLGIPQGLKYSTIELSDDLIYSDRAKTKVRFPELLALREEMELKGVDEYVFHSAFKVGAPTNLTRHNIKEQNVYTNEAGEEVRGIDPKSIVELENKNWRIQLNPIHTLKGQTSHPTQITFFVDMDGKNTGPANKIFKLNGKLIKRGLDRVNKQLGGGNGNITKLRKFFLDSLGDTDARIHDFMSATDEKGNPLLSLNFPTVVNKVVTQIASTVSKATVQVKYNGGKLALQSDFGYQYKDKNSKKRKLQIRTDVTVDGKKVQYAEVLMDNIYKDQFKEGDILFESALAFRIPSTELHSAMPIKIVGFYDSKGSNVVIAPRELTILHGSDYDIDALFIMRRTPYLPKIKKNESYADFAKRKGYKNLLIDGAIIGRKLDGEKIPNYIKTLETEIKELKQEKKTLTDKDEQKELQKTINLLDGVLDDAIKNEIVDTFLEVVTAKRNEKRMLTPISMARFNDEKNPNSVFSKLKDIGVVTEKQYDLNNPLHQMQIHQDNFSGTAIVGAIADLVRGLAYVNQAYKPSSQKKLEYLSKGFAGHTMKTFDEQNEIIKGLTEQFKAKEITEEVYKEKVNEIINGLSKYYGVNWKTTPIDRGVEWMEMDGRPYTELAMKEKDSKGVFHTISDTFDALINAALDNVKEQILPIINLTNNTVKGYFGMLAVGMPLDFVVKQMLTPGIKNLSTARNMKYTLGETRTLVAGMIAADPKAAAMTPEQLGEFKVNTRFTEEALDNLVKKSLEEDFSIDKLTLEELIIQEKALTNFASANSLGEEIGKAAKATKILKQIPVAQEEIQDLVDLFDEIKAAKTGLLSKINMMKIPHIKEAHNSLVKVSGIVNNQFYKHREEINNVAKEIVKSTGIKLDSNSNKSKRMVREEIMRMFMSGFTYKADGITVDLNTSDEYPFNPFKLGKKGEQTEIEDAKPLTGLNAFNQRFAEDVLNAKKANPTNLFLDKIRIAPQLGAGKNMYQVEYNTTAAMEQSEIQDLQDSFNELKVDGKYTPFQHMFVKYAALNQGLSFGLSSYSLLLPAEIYAGFDAQMNKFFSTLLSPDEARQPDIVKARMDKLTDYFSAKLARKFPSKLATNKEFVVKPGTIYPMQGYDTMTDGSLVHYELKFKHEDAEKTTQTVPEGNEKDELITDNYEKEGLPSNEAQDAPITPDDEELTKEIKINGFPQFLSYYDKSYVKVESRTGDPFVYYQYLAVEKKGDAQGYEFDRNVLFFGYNVKDVFRRDIKTRVVPKASDQNTYESEVKYSKFKVGDTISLRTLNDAERLNSFDYTIAKETYYKGKTEVATREEAGENGKVVYDLKDGRKVISFNREELSEDDIKDLDNLCK